MIRQGTAERPVDQGLRSTPSVVPAAPLRTRSRGKLALSVFAMLASAGIALVSVTDPYAGATAAPSYQQPVMADKHGLQRYEIEGGYVLVDPKRDTFTTVLAPSGVGGAAAVDTSSSSSGGGGGYVITPVGTAQAYAAKAVASRGWAPSEFGCLVSLWNRESGWNTHASNPSGAYGIPQALPGSKMGAGWQNDYRTQVNWGLGYISGRYGSPCGAWGHSNAAGWY